MRAGKGLLAVRNLGLCVSCSSPAGIQPGGGRGAGGAVRARDPQKEGEELVGSKEVKGILEVGGWMVLRGEGGEVLGGSGDA